MKINQLYKIAKNELFPICRSLTGNGNRKTLRIIKKKIKNLNIVEVPSGTKVFDWKIPPEWNVTDAYILNSYGKKIVDFKNNNLHLVGYSQSINKTISKKELISHLHTLPKQPHSIPYITSYYKKYWGFCVSHFFKKKIESDYKKNDKFKVVIKSKLSNKGKLTYGELVIPGTSSQEILISTYICHPSMANNELSGIIVSMALINFFKKKRNLQKTLRFLFIPETIGSINYINKNLTHLKSKVIGGYNLSCIGDERKHSCMFSKYGNSHCDRSLHQAYKSLNLKFKKYSFLERGSDERQFSSPGIDLPIASIFRSKYGTYPEYHTSDDNFNLVTVRGLEGGFKVAKKAIEILIKKIIPKTTVFCEPKMSKYGLYPTISRKDNKHFSKHLMDFLQYADGTNDINQISKLIKVNKSKTKKYKNLLLKYNLINC